MKCTPKLNAIYWCSLSLASIFGANAGDFLADALGLGHLSGLPWLAALLAIIFVADHFLAGSALLFWAAIITIRAGATNIGDWFHDLHFDFTHSIPVVAIVLFGLVAVTGALAPKRDGARSIIVNPAYWVIMCAAGILGTLVGDYVSYPVGLGNLWAAIALGVPFVLVLLLAGNRVAQLPFLYWAVVALIRSAGTAAGDLLAHRIFGLNLSTLLTGAVFVAVVVTFYALKPENVIRNDAAPDALAAGRA